MLWSGQRHQAIATLRAAGYEPADIREFLAWNQYAAPYGPLSGATMPTVSPYVGALAAVVLIVGGGLLVAKVA